MKSIIFLFLAFIFIVPANADTRYSLSLGLYPDYYRNHHNSRHFRDYHHYGYRRPYRNFYRSPVIVLPNETMVIEKEPEIYIEKDVPSGSEQTSKIKPENYWYYCKDPEGYYPQVEACPKGWMQVVPHKPKQ
ncbi:MAG: hypothetical protein HQL46_01995 [Gammaproteobacteria bacterium]|nr:hypothetical protein [Gammaproteobacteria bacterium]